MTRLTKLYRKLLDGRPLAFAEFESLLVAFGYRRVRQKGSHTAYRHDGIGDTRIIQPRGKEAKPYQVRQFVDKVEQYALTLDNENGTPV